MDFQLLETVAALGTAAATITLVVILYRTIRQMEVTVKLSQIQTEFRFRPWIGPASRFQRIEPSINDKIQFEVTLKNFGELPAEGVLAKFISDKKLITKTDLMNHSHNQFELGPMLPNMEKHYWFFIEPEVWKKAVADEQKLFTEVYFEYIANGKKTAMEY